MKRILSTGVLTGVVLLSGWGGCRKEPSPVEGQAKPDAALPCRAKQDLEAFSRFHADRIAPLGLSGKGLFSGGADPVRLRSLARLMRSRSSLTSLLILMLVVLVSLTRSPQYINDSSPVIDFDKIWWYFGGLPPVENMGKPNGKPNRKASEILQTNPTLIYYLHSYFLSFLCHFLTPSGFHLNPNFHPFI